LKEIQKAAGKGEGSLPLKAVGTRWSTNIYALESIVKIKDAINIGV
jgi:hypothetical protein